MLKRTVPLLALASLATATGVAAAQQQALTGRTALVATGPIQGDVQIAGAAGARGNFAHYLVDSGYVGVVSVGRGFEIDCSGEMESRRDSKGHLQALCHGSGLHVRVSGGHFTFKAAGARLGAFFPDSAQGSLTGNYSVCGGALSRPRPLRAAAARPFAACGGPPSAPPAAGAGFDPDVNGDGKIDDADVAALLGK
jgi:hypothetical protein